MGGPATYPLQSNSRGEPCHLSLKIEFAGQALSPIPFTLFCGAYPATCPDRSDPRARPFAAHIPHTLIGSTPAGLFVWCSLDCKRNLYFTGCAINFAVGIKA